MINDVLPKFISDFASLILYKTFVQFIAHEGVNISAF